MVAIQRLAMGLLALTLLGPSVPLSKLGTSVAILNATVIDGTGAEPKPNQTLIIQGERITAIGDGGVIAVPTGARIVDATGKFLIPGLWDMHVHALAEERREQFMAMFLASGVTGIRDLGSSPRDFERLRGLRLMIEEGELPGPRIVAAGPILDGPDPMFPELSIAVDSETAGRDAVTRLCRAGTDFIKVYTMLPRGAYFAIAEECRLRGLVLAGHVPDSVTAEEASDAGQKSIEHLTGILLSCSTMEQELRSRLLNARASNDPGQIYRALMSVQTEGLRTYDQTKARSLFQTFVKNGTWQVPTLVTTRALFVKEEARSDRKGATRLERKQPWTVGPALPMAGAGGNDRASRDASGLFRLVSEMHQAGVQVMAGTDTPNPLALPGQSLHTELALLVEAGFTPMEALQAATFKPAEYLGLADRLGSIETGKIADLVLLNADPLADIRNVGEVFAVVVRGTILIKSELDEQLAGDGKGLSRHLYSGAGLGVESQQKKLPAQRTSGPGRDEILEAEQRLSELGYWTGAIDGVADDGLRHALIAFQKVEGRPRTGKLAIEELQALRSARRPAPVETGPFHVEIDLTRQVLFLVDNRDVKGILQVSTGTNQWFTSASGTRRACTPCGRFVINRKVSGWRKSELGLMYYPNYIVGGVAIHGSKSVPAHPASHGCIRIPMFAAKGFSEITPIGTPVIVYAGSVQP